MPTSDRENRLAAYIGELVMIEKHIAADADLTDDDKRQFAPLADAIADAGYNLCTAARGREDDEREQIPAEKRIAEVYLGGAS